ncbi:hypothetical protein O6H91_17G073900 [Diphasiastrum complanatum]|uniref:Uncharacterized protein n=1 Tax=Diphasiastrum complanatum TaxID=34168 RepID=A0ACC2B7X5_DIPCM|nr:hypothetical protein O6H91_17G073900 [Diphasiastrum complanatum]
MLSQPAESSTNIFSCAVKRKEAKLVAPSLPPPAKDGIYWLSNLDTPMMVNIVFFYESNEVSNTADPVMVLQNAVARSLVHYYPLAGRVEQSSNGKFQVISSGGGAVFVEAEADANISDVMAEKNLDINMEYAHKLVYTSVGASKSNLDKRLLAIQVTRFKWGGFCVGVSINHCICDGIAYSEFLISLGEIARGVPISIPPPLDRTLLKARDPLQIENPFSEIAEIDQSNSQIAHDPSDDGIARDPLKIDNVPTAHNPSVDDMVFSFLCFDSNTIDLLKKQVLDEGILKTCTSLEVIGASIWRIRTKALCMPSSQLTKFEFAIDCRTRFCPPRPKGYHGNAVVTTCAIASAGELTDRELSYAVGLIQEAKAMIYDKYLRSRIDYLEQTRPLQLSLITSTLLISSWCGIPFHKADYGWGEAPLFFPVGQPIFGIGVFLAYGKDRKGIKFLTSLPSVAWGNIKFLLQQQTNPEISVEMATVR